MLLAKTFRSRTFRIALTAIAGFGTIVLSLLGYIYWSTTSYVASRSDRAIAVEQSLLQAAYDQGGRGALEAAIKTRIAEKAFNGGLYLLADQNFKPVAGDLDSWPHELSGASGFGNFGAPDTGGRSSYRALIDTLPDNSHLLVGRNAEDLESFKRTIDTALAFTLLLIAVLAGVVSILVTRRTVGRIESINATSRAIMERGLAARIGLRGVNDEWDELARNLNSMLDRIEALMREVREVTDNVAHDLRTPLARIRGRLEKASGSPRSAESDQKLIDDMIGDLDDVLRIFSSLMRISQIESAARTEGFAVVDLAAVARDVVELFDAAAEEKPIELSVAGDPCVVVTGDRDLLFDAVANLVDNAIKYGKKNGLVTVTVRALEHDALIAVADDGPGIPSDEFAHIFKRFYRLERSRCTAGNGLGLSLVAAVAHLHRARIDLKDNQPGLAFRLIIPSGDAAFGEKVSEGNAQG
ncbi:MAG TPA: HAMP domain-containing sensor histidine kinase [Methylovirgula sp.]